MCLHELHVLIFLTWSLSQETNLVLAGVSEFDHEINRNKDQKCHLLWETVVSVCRAAPVWELREALPVSGGRSLLQVVFLAVECGPKEYKRQSYLFIDGENISEAVGDTAGR